MIEKPNKTFADLQIEAEGQWPFILEDLAPELSEAIATQGRFHVSCPVHGGSDGFRLFRDFTQTGGGVCNTCGPKGSGFALLAWVKGYSSKDATREVAQWLRGEEFTPTVVHRKPIVYKPVDTSKNRKNIEIAWGASLPLKDSCAEKYLENRGVWKENMPKSLRFHKAMNFYDPKTKTSLGDFPCMLAPVTDKDGTLICLHRTFVTADGKKAPVPEAKKLMAKYRDLNGGAIKLYPSSEVLGVAEGIETALAVHAIARIPMWSCVSAKLMEDVDIPASVRHVVIWADLDRSRTGEKSAEVLATRLVAMGKTVEIVMPQGPIPEGEKGIDWLDVLLTKGIEGFPLRWRNYRPPVVQNTTVGSVKPQTSVSNPAVPVRELETH